jgi:hypothetical protein
MAEFSFLKFKEYTIYMTEAPPKTMTPEAVKAVLEDIRDNIRTHDFTARVIRGGQDHEGKVDSVGDSHITLKMKNGVFTFHRTESVPLEFIAVTNKRKRLLPRRD